ncbi:hypothetical protein ACI65C_011921 [Semiaphis heraclei]
MPHGCPWMVPLFRWALLSGCVARPLSSDTKMSEVVTQNMTKENLTCYTCVNVSDNLTCNQYAIDKPCARDLDYCQTLHIMDSTGSSVIVNKKCANRTECHPSTVGCLSIDRQTVCVSCCDDMYCNMTVPTNQTNAVITVTRKRHMNPTKGPKTKSASDVPCTQLTVASYYLLLFLMLFTTILQC